MAAWSARQAAVVAPLIGTTVTPGGGGSGRPAPPSRSAASASIAATGGAPCRETRTAGEAPGPLDRRWTSPAPRAPKVQPPPPRGQPKEALQPRASVHPPPG